jgi:mannosyltransferase
VSERGQRRVLLGLCVLAFALRVMGLEFQSLWRDEVDALRFALQPLADVLQMFVSPGENGPLYYLLLRPWLRVAGQSEFSLRFFSAALGVLAVPLVYRLARRLFASRPFTAPVAALLSATSPYLIWYGQEGKMYALVVLLVLLSMERFLSAMELGGWHRWLGYLLATGAAFYVHLTAVLIVPVQVAGFWLYDRQRRSVRWRPWLVSLSALLVPYLPLLAWQLPLLMVPGQTGFRFEPLHAMIRSLLVNYSLGVVPGAALWVTGLFVAVLLLGGALLTADRSLRTSLGILLCWLTVPLAGLFLVSLIRPLYTARYLIFVLPAYVVLLAAGVTAIGRRAPWLGGLLLGAVLAVNCWGLWRQATMPIKADFRGATSYLTRRMAPGDLILFQIPHGRHSFEYYARAQADQRQMGAKRADSQPLTTQHTELGQLAQRDDHHPYRVLLPWVASGDGMAYTWAEGLYTNHGMDPDQVNLRMSALIAGSRVVWFVATEVPMWDERRLVKAWLDQHGVLTDEESFVRVSVHRYELP